MTQSNKSASISIRRGIAFGFSPPYEDTNTLVLTSPAGRFVDIRFPLSSSSDDASEAYTKQPSFWAFAGSSTSFKPQKGDFPAWPCTSHCVWTHELDSRGEGINDEGDVFDLQNGGSMEVGVMKNPESGKEEWYKEYWTSLEGEEELVPCLVAEVVGEEGGGLKGRIVRVGRHGQGIVEATDGDEVVEVQRWIYRNGKGREQWVREQPSHEDVALSLSRNGSSSPYAWLLAEPRQLDDEMVEKYKDGGSRRWRIIECITQQ